MKTSRAKFSMIIFFGLVFIIISFAFSGCQNLFGKLTVNAPSYNPPAGSYINAQMVTISSTTSGASIRYTTDGSTPSDTIGTVYSGPFSIGVSETIKAIAYESGWSDSTVAVAEYSFGGTVKNFTGFSDPGNIVIDGSGNLWVGSGNSSTLTKLSSSGSVLDTYSIAGASITEPIGLDASGYLWVETAESPSSATETILDSASGAVVASYTQSFGTTGREVDAAGNLWLAIYGSDAIAKLTFSGAVTEYTNGSIVGDAGIAIDSSGNIWTVGYNTNNVAKFSSSGSVLGTYGPVGSYPGNLAIDPSGNIWVLNTKGNSVTKLSSTGAVSGTYSVSAGTPGPVAIDHSGNIWIVNTSSNSITEITSTGSITKTFSFSSSPNSVAIDQSGNVWVSNGTNTLTELTGATTGPQYFPIGPSTSTTQYFLYVGNLNDNTVSAYTINTSSGALTAINGSPFASGTGPKGIAISSTGKLIYITNFSNSNISAYTINSSTGVLETINGSPFAAATGSNNLISDVVDPTGEFLYASNWSESGDVYAYTINSTTGVISSVNGSPFATGNSPNSIAIDMTGKFLYVANHDSDNVSAFSINTSSGSLATVSGSPFPAGTYGKQASPLIQLQSLFILQTKAVVTCLPSLLIHQPVCFFNCNWLAF